MISRIAMNGIKPLMAPSFDLRVRIYACILEQCLRYQTELACAMFPGNFEWDSPVLVPMNSLYIRKRLEKEFTEHPIADKAQKQDKAAIRQALQSLEKEGFVVRVAIREASPLLPTMTLADAMAQGLVAKLASLSKSELGGLQRKTAVYLNTEAWPG